MLSAWVGQFLAISGLMYLKASGWVTPAAKNSVSDAMRLASEANLMNSRQASAFGVPARIDQLSTPHRFWFQTIATGAPSAIALCGRETQVAIKSTSPDLSICSTCAPEFHHTSTFGLTFSRPLSARSISSGYRLDGATPWAISDSSSVSNGCLRNDRRPGKSLTFQKSAHESGALRFLKASVR